MSAYVEYGYWEPGYGEGDLLPAPPLTREEALKSPAVRLAYFAHFEFATTPLRACSLTQSLDWSGHTWVGLGAIAGISEIEESDSLESKSLQFTLNAADPSWLAISSGAVEEYRGRAAKLYFCPLDESYRLIGEPEICWRGIMDVVSVGIDRDGEETTGQIVLKCETSSYGLKRQPALRLNDPIHRKKHPTDRGFEYLNDLIANPQQWVSVRFQQI